MRLNHQHPQTMMAKLLLLITWISLASGSLDQAPEVNTPLGKIIGKTVYFQEHPVSTFQSIPFAKPPLGEYRFKKPQPVAPWEEPLVADHLPPGCIQHSSNPFPWLDDLPGKSMDCLYLNVWVPSAREESGLPSSSKKTVMFWLHGGGFRIGSSRLDFYDGRALAALGDVIVVTTNFRLGVEGFLYSGTEDAPGNMGLYDVVEALKWVNANIEYFGGNKDNITFFGQSSGAIAAGMFMVSPLARGLFTRAILQSGSATNLDAEDNDRDFELSEGVAKAVHCAPGEDSLNTNPNAVVGCLRGKDALELAKTVGQVSDNPQRGLYPRYGDEILPYNARQAIIDGKFENIDILIGDVRDEGSIMITKANKEVFGFFGHKDNRVNKTFGEHLIRNSFKAFGDADAVVRHYLGSLTEEEEEAVLKQVQYASGDYARVCPVVFFAERLAEKGNRVFYYYFVHRPSESPWAPWMGVVHFEETPFVFGYPLRYPDKFTSMEQDLSRRMLSVWSTFAKTGSLEDWPLYTKDQHHYQTLDTNPQRIGTGPHLENCNFFRPYFGF